MKWVKIKTQMPPKDTTVYVRDNRKSDCFVVTKSKLKLVNGL